MSVIQTVAWTAFVLLMASMVFAAYVLFAGVEGPASDEIQGVPLGTDDDATTSPAATTTFPPPPTTTRPGPPGAGPGQTQTVTPTPSQPAITSFPMAQDVTVTFVDVPEEVHVFESFRVVWRAEAVPNETARADYTGVVYADRPIDTTNATTNDANFTYSTVLLPDDFNVTIRNDTRGPLYLRAFAHVGSERFWSAQAVVNLTWEVFTVDITPGLQFANFDPGRLIIRQGDAVQWHNGDVTQHSAVNDTAHPVPFDTGAIAPTSTSLPIHFDVSGIWDYHCSFHPGMQARFVVEETL